MTEVLDSPDSTGGGRPDRRSTVSGSDGELAVFEWGDSAAEPLVLVHGLSDTHRVWAEVATLLADGFRVVTYDVRGHGRSAKPVVRQDYRLDRLADDLFAVVDAVGQGAPVHVCGHGWGAVQAWEAVCDPRANTRIASFTAITGPNLDHIGMLVRRASFSPRHARTLAADPKWWLRSAGTTQVAAQRLICPPRVQAMLIERLGGIARRSAPIAATWRTDLVAGARIVHANLLHHLLRPRERRTAVPVQMIVDTTDIFVPPFLHGGSAQWVDRLWRCAIPANHWLPVTEPLLVAEAVANFIEDLHAADSALPQR